MDTDLNDATGAPCGIDHRAPLGDHESVMGAQDTDEDLSAMRGIFAAAIPASEILGEDQLLRVQWREMLDNLAPIPTSDQPGALRPDDYSGPRVFVRGLKPVIAGSGFTPDGNSLPMWFFDLVNLDSPDAAMMATAGATFDRAFRNGIGPDTPVGVLSKMAIAGTTLGRVEATKFLVPNQMRVLTTERGTAYRGGGTLANRLTLREGPQALDAQRLGRAAEALPLALLQSAPGTPAGDSAIRLFPAWPDECDAQFTLRARGAFVVTASRKRGRTDRVELGSEAGAILSTAQPVGLEARHDRAKRPALARIEGIDPDIRYNSWRCLRRHPCRGHAVTPPAALAGEQETFRKAETTGFETTSRRSLK
jgi:hypothetical protein